MISPLMRPQLDSVLNALVLRSATASDLMQATGFGKNVISRILRELRFQKEIHICDYRYRTGRSGTPSIVYKAGYGIDLALSNVRAEIISNELLSRKNITRRDSMQIAFFGATAMAPGYAR